MPGALGGRRADEFPVAGLQAALLGLDEAVEILRLEDKLIVEASDR